MSYCKNCGIALVENAKFCQKCGYPTKIEKSEYTQRQQEFVGKIYKCPNCGEVLKSFEINCPACGLELRGTRVSSAVKEFALKLEAIEARREYEKPRGLFTTLEASQRMSKTDEQKISLIKSFSVPNSKEDMLEFMVLATSSINMRVYDSANTDISKSEKEVNAAWFSKVQQVYDKAKRSYSTDDTFIEIKALYDRCNRDIQKSMKKGIIKWVLLFGWLPLMLVGIIIYASISYPKDNAKEEIRLESIVVDIDTAMEHNDYKLALRNAESMEYKGHDAERERWWGIKKETLIDEIIDMAERNGVHLERSLTITDESNDNISNGGFIKGFREGLKPGLDDAKENINEFNRIMNEGTKENAAKD